MSKFPVIIFSLLSVSIGFANSIHPLMHVESLPHLSNYKTVSQAAPVMQNHADFTGRWLGTCQAEGQESRGEKEFLEIQNNRDWIQVCSEDTCEAYNIGKDNSQHQVLGDMSYVEHANLTWSTDTSLLMNLVAVYSRSINGEYFISSLAGRSILTLKEDKLVVQHEYYDFDGTEKVDQSKFVCELVRQPIA